MANAAEISPVPLPGAQLWPLSVKAYHLDAGKKIEVYRQPKDGQFSERSVHGPGGSLRSAALSKFTPSLESLFPKEKPAH